MINAPFFELLTIFAVSTVFVGLCQLRHKEGRVALVVGAGMLCMASPFWIPALVG